MTSTSWGWGSSGSQKNTTKSIRPSAMAAPTCWSPPSGPLRKRVTSRPSSVAMSAPVVPVAYSSCCVERLAVVARPLEHVRLPVVVRDQRDPLACAHEANLVTRLTHRLRLSGLGAGHRTIQAGRRAGLLTACGNPLAARGKRRMYPPRGERDDVSRGVNEREGPMSTSDRAGSRGARAERARSCSAWWARCSR